MDYINNNTNNEMFFNTIASEYPNLLELSIDSNRLKYREYMVDLKQFNLQDLKTETFQLSPFMFLNLVKIHTDVLDEIEYLKTNNYNNNYLYFEVRTILVKSVLDFDDANTLKRFIKAYKELNAYQDFLVGDALNKLISMQSVIRDNIYSNVGENLTPGQVLLMNEIYPSTSEQSKKEKGLSLVLSNPKFPSTIEDNMNFPKAGYASILLILYIVINIGFILAVFLFKN